MQHRVFIAINFPKGIKEKLYQAKNEYLDLPCKWTRRDNLHLTLLFLGRLNDEEVLETCKVVREIGEKHAPFALKLNQIAYGPPNPVKKQSFHGAGKLPRMVWANGIPSKELTMLKNDIENSLYNGQDARYTAPRFEKAQKGLNEENHQFSPHVTLARIKEWQLRQMEIEEIPQIDKEISLTFSVESIEVMESELKKEGPEYSILESCPLSN